MRVFISWSGALSKEIAGCLAHWIECVLLNTRPWISTEDIEKGSMWYKDISDELRTISVGIICLTRENMNSPWILFETGALSKGLHVNRVIPLLVNLAPADLTPPLSMFNAALPNKPDMLLLIKTINAQNGEHKIADEALLVEIFEHWWNDFQVEYERIVKTIRSPKTQPRKLEEMMEEVVLSTRAVQNYLLQEDAKGRGSATDTNLLLNRLLEQLDEKIARGQPSLKSHIQIIKKALTEGGASPLVDPKAYTLLAIVEEIAKGKMLTFYQPRGPESPFDKGFKYLVQELHDSYKAQLIEQLKTWLRADNNFIRWMASEIIGYYSIESLKEELLVEYAKKSFDDAWPEWQLNYIWAHSKLANQYKEMHLFLLNTTIEFNQEWLLGAYVQMVKKGHCEPAEFLGVLNDFTRRPQISQRIKEKAEVAISAIKQFMEGRPGNADSLLQSSQE